MSLVRLIYTSQGTAPVRHENLMAILESSRRFNSVHAITGMLCAGEGRFIQYLEGQPEGVNELYARIMRDERHSNLILKTYGEIKERLFADWSMGYADIKDADISQIHALFGMDGFNVQNLNADKAAALIEIYKRRLASQYTVEPDIGDVASLVH